MRRARLLAPAGHPSAFYHCVSRVVDRRFIFDSFEKNLFLRLMRELAEFCQVRVLTYCIMSNHFHLLVEVPKTPAVLPTAEETLVALQKLSGRQDIGAALQRLQGFRESGDAAGEARWLARYHARRWNLSFFLKLLKQRFTVAYNRKAQRKGTLWEERFRSVLIEGAGRALMTIAAYIDLNPIRACLVDDPKDYRWSGYGEAVAGQQVAQEGLRRLAGILLGETEPALSSALSVYRQHLYCEGSEDRESIDDSGRTSRGSFSRTAVLEVLRNKGRLPISDYLRCRIRYFCDGAILGCREFVEDLFHHHRNRFPPNRRSGARAIRGLDKPGLFTWRDFRVNVFG